MRPLIQLAVVQLKEFFREPGVFFWAFIFPAGMAWVLGVAFSGRQEFRARIAFREPEALVEKQAVGRWQRRLETEGGSGISVLRLSEPEIGQALRQGTINLFLEYRGATNGGPELFTFHFDPRNEEAERSYLRVEKLLRDAAPEPAVVAPSIRTETATLNAPGTRYIDFLAPGLIAMSIMNSCLWGIGYGLIELRIKKFLRRMVASPMKKWQFLFSCFLARLLFTSLEAGLLFLFVHFYFGVRITGSFAALIAVFVMGNFCFSGLAILLSSRAQNARSGSGMINSATIPMIILSGIFFNYHHFPEPVTALIRWIPLTLLADSLRSVFLEGQNLATMTGPALMLGLLGALFFGLGLKIYRWY